MPIRSTIFCPDFGTANRAYAEALAKDVTKLRLDYIGDSNLSHCTVSVPYEWTVSFECISPDIASDILEGLPPLYESSEVSLTE